MGRDGQLETLLSVSRGKNRQTNFILSALFLLYSPQQHLAVLQTPSLYYAYPITQLR